MNAINDFRGGLAEEQALDDQAARTFFVVIVLAAGLFLLSVAGIVGGLAYLLKG